MAFSGPNMCNLVFNNENRSLLVKSSLLKKWHYLDLVVVVVVVVVSVSHLSLKSGIFRSYYIQYM